MKHKNINKLEKINERFFTQSRICKELTEIINDEKVFNKRVIGYIKHKFENVVYQDFERKLLLKDLEPEEKNAVFTQEQRYAINEALNDLVLKLNNMNLDKR